MVLSSARAAALIAVVALVLALPAGTAWAQSSNDASATRSYLQADLQDTRAEVEGLPAAFAAIEALRAGLQAECPDVLAGEPKPAAGATPSSSAAEIEEELLGAVLGAAERTELSYRRRFSRSVSNLSWGDRALTRRVRSYAAAELALAQAPAPDLCADLRAWVGSGYRTVSAATQLDVQHRSKLSAATEGAGEAIMRKLRRYESAADKRVARQISEVEQHGLRAALPQVFADLAKIAEVLHGSAAAPAT
jgi:hypothetical protein